MISAQDVTRLQTAVGSQQAGNDLIGNIMYKGGFSTNSSGAVLTVSGPFTVVPGAALGEPVGVFRVYPIVNGSIVSVDHITQQGFTPRNPGAAETTIVQCTGYGIDVANNKNYITLQLADFTGALQGSIPSFYVVGVECSLSLSTQSNPL